MFDGEIVNNREIATIFWFIVLLFFSLSKSRMRNSVKRTIKCFLDLKIISPIIILIGYLLVVIAILYRYEIWSLDLLKETILWILTTAIVSYLNLYKHKSVKDLLRDTTNDYLKIIIFYEFLFNSYTFNIYIEFIMVPVIIFIVIMTTICKNEEKYIAVYRVFYTMQAIIGMLMIIATIIYTINNLSNIFMVETLINFLLPLFLMLLTIPYYIIIMLIMAYELLFIRIKLSTANKSVKRKAKLKIVKIFKMNIRKIHIATNMGIYNLMQIKCFGDIKEMEEIYTNLK